jgi:membrane-bound metal-dependent hydrolase YbcI (DUF457 family)
MSTLVGHALAGVAVSMAAPSRFRPQPRPAAVIAVLLASVLADVDVVLLLVLRDGTAAHRGLTHSVLASGVIAATLALALRRAGRTSPPAAFGVLFAAALSHLVLDWAMGAGPAIRPLAPFAATEYLAPVRLVPTAYYASSAAGYASHLFWFGNALALALEILLFAPLIVVGHRGSTRRLRILAGLTSAVAFVATYRLFN